MGSGDARGRTGPARLRVTPGVLGVTRPEGLSAIMSKWLLPSRLETRTKESKTRASLVVEKPTGVMKVTDATFLQHRPAMTVSGKV